MHAGSSEGLSQVYALPLIADLRAPAYSLHQHSIPSPTDVMRNVCTRDALET